MKRRVALFASALCIGGAAIAAAQDPTVPDPAGPARTTTDEARSTEDRARRARVIARVGEVEITVGEVEDAIAEQSTFLRLRYRDPAEVRTLVQSMVRFELLAHAAAQSDVGEDPDIRRVVRQSLVQRLILEEIDDQIRPATIEAEAVRQYYESNPQEFSRAEMRRASHVQVATREDAERLLTEAEGADARAFRALAIEHSMDPETRLRGGDLRYFDADGRPRNNRDPRVDESLAAASFALEDVGEIGGPVQVGDRWSLVMLTGRREAEHRTLEQAEPVIRLRLWRPRRQQALDDLVGRLRQEAGVETHPERLREIRLDQPSPEDAPPADGH